MEYFPTIEKKHIMLFATTWMNLEGIMLREISQRDTSTVLSHLYRNLKKLNTGPEIRLVVARGWGVQEMDEDGQGVQTSSYKMNRFWGSNVQHGDYS